MSAPDITAIITAHAEGAVAGVSLRSFRAAVDAAQLAGIAVEALVVLDNADDATRAAFAEVEDLGYRLLETSHADQGRVRNDVVEVAAGAYVAFLDGDDLWSDNWLVGAYAACLADPGRVIAHPALDWVFGGEEMVCFFPDGDDPAFDPASVRVQNPWDALCLAPVAAYRDHPFAPRAIDEGWAYEDWHWNMETLVAGYRHVVVPETIHFKRRREGSQFVEARATRALPRPSRLLDYAWWRQRGS